MAKRVSKGGFPALYISLTVPLWVLREPPILRHEKAKDLLSRQASSLLLINRTTLGILKGILKGISRPGCPCNLSYRGVWYINAIMGEGEGFV